MEWAIVGALLMGLTLGLLGSGGSIFCVPVLVYILGHDEKQAITESLAIVGAVAIGGAIQAMRRKELDVHVAAMYAIPGLGGSVLGAWVSQWFSGGVQLAMLAMIMLIVATLMFRKPIEAPEGAPEISKWSAPVQGFGIGILTGLLGVGGGFLIMSSLVLLRRMDMPLAIGTSLAVIAANCAAGLSRHLMAGQHLPDWSVVAIFSVIGILGSFGGMYLAKKLNRVLLRRIFAVFLIFLAAYMIVRELPKVMQPTENTQQVTKGTQS